jgi:hypothetical protein
MPKAGAGGVKWKQRGEIEGPTISFNSFNIQWQWAMALASGRSGHRGEAGNMYINVCVMCAMCISSIFILSTRLKIFPAKKVYSF